MELVFFSSFDKLDGNGQGVTGQVAIFEHHGIWQIRWSEAGSYGQGEPDVWFEGTSWDNMIAIFREKLQQKTDEGFKAIIPSYADGEYAEPDGKVKLTAMLHYYSELHRNDELYEQLRQWRKQQSAKENKAPFMLASNRALGMISAFVPHTKEELLQIPGFGENRFRMYGEQILKLTKLVPRTAGFPLDWVEQAIGPEQFRDWWNKQKALKSKSAMDKKTVKKSVLDGIAAGKTVASLAEQLCVSGREIILWVEQLNNEGYEVAPIVELELRQVPPDELSRAVEEFEKSGDRYLKPVFQALYGSKQMEQFEQNQAYDRLRLIRLRRRNGNAAERGDVELTG